MAVAASEPFSHRHAFDGCHLVTLVLQMPDVRLLMGQASIAQQFQCRIPTVRLDLEADLDLKVEFR